MRGTLKSMTALAVLAAVCSAPAAAQGSMPVSFGVDGGIAIPLGNFNNFAKTGWNAGAFAAFTPVTLPVGFRIEGFYQQNKPVAADVGTVNKYNMLGGTADVTYTFKTAPASMFHPYLIGGVGVYNFKEKDVGGASFSTTKMGLNAGAGFAISSASNIGFFVEGRFHTVFTQGTHTNFIPINVGIHFGG